MDFRKIWIELIILGVAIIAILAIAISVIEANLLLIGLVAICVTSPKSIPLAWSAFKSVSSFIDDKKVQNEQLLLISSARERMMLGDDLEYNNAVMGISFKINLPRREVTVEEVEEEEEDQLQIEAPKSENEHLNISDDYQPHADEFLSARKLVVGVSGSGKSNTVGTICEELGRFDVPMILADTEDEYQPLADRRYLPNGIIVNSKTINVDNATQFGHYVLENNIQAILNLQSFEMEESAWVMVNLIQGLREWQEERANDVRIPCEFLLEEATTWLPQNVKESPLNDTEVMAKLQNAFFNDLVRKGRKRGLGLTVICQKIAEIDKRALQCDVKLLHRQTELNDLEKYRKMGITNEETLSLQQGEGYFFSSRVNKTLIQVRKRYSDHGANTPGLSELRARQKSRNQFGESLESGNGFTPMGNSAETALELVLGGINDAFTNDTNPPLHTAKLVSDEKRETVKRMVDMGIPHRDVARAVGLSGRKYQIYQQVCKEEGIVPHESSTEEGEI